MMFSYRYDLKVEELTEDGLDSVLAWLAFRNESQRNWRVNKGWHVDRGCLSFCGLAYVSSRDPYTWCRLLKHDTRGELVMFGDSPEFLTGLQALDSSIVREAHRTGRGVKRGELERAVCKALEERRGKVETRLDKLYKAYREKMRSRGRGRMSH